MKALDFNGDGPPPRRKARGTKGNIAAQQQRRRERQGNKRRQNIMVLDVETNPFDNVAKTPVYPFLCVLYSDQFPTITIWDEDWKELVRKVLEALDAFEEPFIIYAHNGGRFDYMFFMHLITGEVKFKGRTLMSAKLGKHELRDSQHIIPESLANANRKDSFDYKKMRAHLRGKHRLEIIAYCISDCEYTFEIVRAFIDRFGLPISIGQAAMKEFRKHYHVERLNEREDRYFRQWFYGGRVECLSKPGRYSGEYELYDVNSMYASVMAHIRHPIGRDFFIGERITSKTAFVHLACQNRGAFVHRQIDGELTANLNFGEFHTTIHEYKTALELGMISNVSIIKTVDMLEWSSFENFVNPIYDHRQVAKAALETDPDNLHLQKESKLDKYVLNNAWGKQAQNPRKFKDHYLTVPGEHPPLDWLYQGVEFEAKRLAPSDIPDGMEAQEYVKRSRSTPSEETSQYTVWSRPSPEWRFNNVATAASITGAARAKLLRAIFYADTPLYCDTDSIVCRSLGNHDFSHSKLGWWKPEAEISEFILAGKKLYGYRTPKGKTVIKAKGMQGVTWADLGAIIEGKVVRKVLLGPTIDRGQGQRYMERDLKMTG